MEVLGGGVYPFSVLKAFGKLLHIGVLLLWKINRKALKSF